ncbi:hypothetical protein GCM10023063_33050 [Arthrobacter methylotrophus]
MAFSVTQETDFGAVGVAVGDAETEADCVAPACETVGLAPPQAESESAAATDMIAAKRRKVVFRDFGKSCDACFVALVFLGARVFIYAPVKLLLMRMSADSSI